MIRDAIESRLSGLDSCAVSDALDRMGLPGAVTGIGPLTVTQKVTGRVVTVKLGAASSNRETESRHHLGTRAIEAASPGNIIVVEQRTGIVAGCWGGVLSTAAKVRGIAGIVADGLVRDVDEARGLEFPVYARGSTVLTARGRIVEVERGGTIRVGTARVENGDYVLADSTGVVFLSAHKAEDIVRTAEEIAAREASMTRRLFAGEPASAVMGLNYERMLGQ